jgi:hypothetical protein
LPLDRLTSRLSRAARAVYFACVVPVRGRLQGWRGRSREGGLAAARPYRAGDEQGILRLFHLTFRQDKSPGRWRWEFIDNPCGITNVSVLEHAGAGIVGHYAGIVVPFHIEGDVVRAAQGADLMIHPRFRTHEAFARLVREYLRLSRAQGILLHYGFNERAVARSHRRLFGATLVPVSEWACPIRGDARDVPPSGARRIVQTDAFDARADLLWERVKTHYPCAVVRDRRYLAWRYDRRSDREYTLWELRESRTDALAALAVLGAHESDGLLLELLADPTDHDAVTALLRWAVIHAAASGKRRVLAWLSGDQLQACARTVGFQPLAPRFYLDLLNPDRSMSLETLRAFHYTLGDYDVH